MQTVIIVIHLMIVLAMIGLVLLQRSEGGGLGMGGGAGFMSSRGTANVLTRATAILAGLFFATSLVLSIIAGFSRSPTSILDTATPNVPAGQPLIPPPGGGAATPNQAAPTAPAPAPAEPTAPQMPQVPR